MEDMKKGVLTKALGMLAVLNCQYAVVDPEGNKYGTLEIAEPRDPNKRKYTGIKYLPLFKERVDAIQPSDTVHVFEVPMIEGATLESYRGALCGYCTRTWGHETYSSKIVEGKVHLLRYA